MANGQLTFVISLCFLMIDTVHQGFAKPVHPTPAGVVLVAATVDGRSGTFLVDTGSERSCLDSGFAARLALEFNTIENIREPYKDGKADSIRIRDFGIGSFHLQNVTMLSTNSSTTYLKAGVVIDGILGIDVLRHFTVTLDFSSGSAQFGASARPASAEMVLLQQVGNVYFVPVSVQGVPTRLLLDTGTNSTSISSHAWSRITKHWQPQSTLDGVRSTVGPETTQFALVPKISIGESASRNVGLRIQPQTVQGLFADPDFDGLLGSEVFQKFILTLDFANDRMYLVRNPNRHVDQYRYSTIGIQFAGDANGDFTIMAVWNPSPAATAGLKIGDLIVAVNRLDARRMSLDDLSRQLHGHPGTKVDLVIESGGRRQSVPVAIRCLLCPLDNPLQKVR